MTSGQRSGTLPSRDPGSAHTPLGRSVAAFFAHSEGPEVGRSPPLFPHSSNGHVTAVTVVSPRFRTNWGHFPALHVVKLLGKGRATSSDVKDPSFRPHAAICHPTVDDQSKPAKESEPPSVATSELIVASYCCLALSPEVDRSLLVFRTPGVQKSVGRRPFHAHVRN